MFQSALPVRIVGLSPGTAKGPESSQIQDMPERARPAFGELPMNPRFPAGLAHCRIEARRIEMVEAFAARVISARAFAPLLKLLSLSAPFSTGETTYLLPKGRSAAQELTALPVRSRELFHVEQSLTDPDAGIIVSS